MKPARIVTRWSPILLNKQYVSLCGEDQFGDAWVSTTLAELDIETMTARTVSGRHYRLYGDPDPDVTFYWRSPSSRRRFEISRRRLMLV